MRAHSNKKKFHDPNVSKNLLHTLIPWNLGCSCRGGELCSSEIKDRKIDDVGIDEAIPVVRTRTEDQQKIWRRRVDFNALAYITCLLALILTNVASDLCYHKGKIVHFK